MRALRALTLTCFAASAIPNPGFAACYDVFGCTHVDRFQMQDLTSGPTCDFLYTMRNGIYAEHHYCFHTARGRATFGNAGCVSGDPNALGLNDVELANAVTILRAENAMGCRE